MRRLWLWGGAPLIAVATLLSTLPARSVSDADSSNLVQKLETRRGQAFTDEQRRELGRITSDLRRALGPSHDKFARAISQIFGLSPSQVQAVIPPVSTLGADEQSIMTR